MTKKHFISLADTVRRLRAAYYTQHPASELAHERNKIVAVITSELADWCKDHNREFNRQRWLDYVAGDCGPSGGTTSGANGKRGGTRR